MPPADHGDDVVTVRTGGRTFILVGTAHLSRESADLVREVVERERPDRVCVELDAQRYEALSRRAQWENLDLRQVIRKRQLATLLINLLLASYQKKLGGKLGVQPGAELLGAVEVAEELDIPHTLCDRNIRITLLRAWRSMGIVQKWKLLSAILAGVFTEAELTEDDLRRLRQQDVLSEMMQELAEFMPRLKHVLIDERDAYMAETIRSSAGDRVVAVIGAGPLEGIRAALETGARSSVEELETLPPASSVGKWIGWGIPAAIIAAVTWIGFSKGAAVAGDNLQFWILANGIPSAIGAAIALAHPFTIVAAFVGAPITSLTPVIEGPQSRPGCSRRSSGTSRPSPKTPRIFGNGGRTGSSRSCSRSSYRPSGVFSAPASAEPASFATCSEAGESADWAGIDER